MTWIETAFWILAAFSLVVLGVYPAFLIGLGWCVRRRRERSALDERSTPGDPPRICVAVSAFGRPAQLLDRLRQASAIDYPRDRIEFLILCAADEDLSADIARTLGERHATVIRLANRTDRRTGLAAALERSQSEIVIWLDADWTLPEALLPRLLSHFRDPRVGCVFGRVATTAEVVADEGPFDALRRRLDQAESELGMYLPVEPTVWGARRGLCRQALGDRRILLPELAAAVRRSGSRVIYDPVAVAVRRFAPAAHSGFEQWRLGGAMLARCVRESPSLRRLWGGRAAYGFWIRRGLAWLGPIALGGAFVANVELSSDPWYLRLLLLHESAYVAAVIAMLSVHASRFRWARRERSPAPRA